MSVKTIPLIVLAGSDSKPAALPEAGASLHPLEGPKGIAVEIGGRPLIDLLLDRLLDSGYFDPIYVAGPARLYGASRGPATVIDTDDTFGRNIEVATERVVADCPGQSICFTTCDILPKREELDVLMQDYFENLPMDFWVPIIVAPEENGDLGASAWKPRYRIAAEPGAEPLSLLPGHMVVGDPAAARRALVYRSFNFAYATRNRGILYRLVRMIGAVFGGLIFEDLKLLMHFKMPTLTYTVIRNGIDLALHLRRGVVTADELAERLRRMFVSYRHRRKYPDRRGRFALLPGLSMAKDIDTEEEAEEIASELA